MRAAVRTVRKVTFTPGRHNGRPVPVWMDLPISFEIR
jgi:outer membrane biosynthesis protein TonB